MKKTFALITFAAAAAGATAAWAANTPQAPTLEGAWVVTSWTWSGEEIADPQPGMVIFTGTHYMMMYANGDAPRARYEGEQQSDAEIVAAYNTLTANAGRYEVSGNEITTRAYVAKDPNYMGDWPDNANTYTFRFDGETLHLQWPSDWPVQLSATLDRVEGRPAPLAALIARGDSLELPTEWVPVPGEAIDHHTAGFAKILCSGVFLTGLDPADAAANVGGFTSPFEERAQVVDTVVDVENQSVALTLPSGVVRTAKRYGSQGCVAHAIGEDSVHFVPSVVEPMLPDRSSTPWPMGDVVPDEPWPADIDRAAFDAAMDAGFGPPEAMTLGLVVTYRGRLLGERYADGIDISTPLESWSMGKSLTGTLMGVLIQQGAHELWQPAPVPEWQTEGDPRQAVRIGDIMRMSSGIRIRAPQDPDYDPALGYPDHVYFYTATSNSFEWAATRPQQWEPNTVGRYRNVDPVLTNYLIRLAVEARGENYHAFPQRNLFDKIGIRDAVMETDVYGNFLTQGYEFLPPRDWARLGNLYLQDGVWNGERILPEGYVEYATTLAPAWVEDGRPIYGGAFFWVNGDGGWPLPTTAYGMRGAGGQSATIIPSHGLVVVRLGKYTGARAGGEALNRLFDALMETVPAIE